MSWPGISSMPDYKPCFPRWEGQRIDQIVPECLNDSGRDLMQVTCALCSIDAEKGKAESLFSLTVSP